MPQAHPEFTLPVYFHTFPVDSELSANLATGLIGKFGLLSIGERNGLGNITGDLSWSLEYGKLSGLSVLTGWSNKLGFLRDKASSGIMEYGIYNPAPKAIKSQILQEVDDILRDNPENTYFTDFRDLLPSLKCLLPSSEYQFTLLLTPGDRITFFRIWKEIREGNVKPGAEQLVLEHRQEIDGWFAANPERVLLIDSESSAAHTLPYSILQDMNRNAAISELCELYLCSNPQEKITRDRRKYFALRSWSRLTDYHLKLGTENALLTEHMKIVKERFREIGIDPQGYSHNPERV